MKMKKINLKKYILIFIANAIIVFSFYLSQNIHNASFDQYIYSLIKVAGMNGTSVVSIAIIIFYGFILFTILNILLILPTLNFDRKVSIDIKKNKEKKGYGMKLSGLEFWGSKYDGKCFNELPLFLQNRIYETEFRFTVVNPGTPEEVKRNIFKRLNTGGAPLTSQEIRNALYTGNATMLLAQLAKEKAFLQATCGSIQPNRMLDYEIILRYISFLIRDYPSYNRTFGSDIWLSDTMIILNARPTYELPEFQKRILKRTIAINTIKDLNDEKIKEVFVIAMKRAKLLFGKHAFRKSVPGMRRTPINKSLFESWGVLLGNMSEEHFSCLKRQEKVFFQEYGILLKTKAFEIAISRDSMRHTSVAFRYEKLKELLNKFYDNV